MSTPRHQTSPGSSYFVTTKCWQGRPVFQVPENAVILIRTLFHYRDREAFLLHEFVVMPDHLHLLLTPAQTASLEKAVQLIKGGSSHQIRKQRGIRLEIWQQGFYDWTIRDTNDWQSKAEYIAMNPVSAGLVQNFRDWPYSSASGTFALDPMPLRFLISSGAEALLGPASTSELKLRPPKEKTSMQCTTVRARAAKP
jgi:REP-associated tyrosine transposase